MPADLADHSREPRSPQRPVLAASEVVHRYGSQQVLNGVSLAVGAGEVVVLLGENGAGKTTLMRVLAGELVADGGAIHVGGHDLRQAPEAARAQLIYVAQHPPLAPLASLREHAAAMAGLRGLSADWQGRLQELAVTFRLDHALDRPVRALSGGMAHKAALSLAFLSQVPLLMLDEPHTGLDVRSALALRQLIVQAKASGTGLLLASHLAEATLAVADRALVLAGGKVARQFEPAELRALGGDPRAFEQQVLEAMQTAVAAT
jgi:ABC-2 type transport system ATP-binding protein